MKDEEIFVCNSTYQTGKLKYRLINGGYKQYVCEKCGRTEWEGNPIPLQVHHINGNNTDNRIENLQLLCPNCHACTDTYCGKNIFKKDIIEIHKEKKCKYCGKNILDKGRKVYCSDECRRLGMKILSNDEAKELIIKYGKEQCTFKYIGTKMGISDNAVRKWCVKIGLPNKTKELKMLLKDL